MVYELSDLCRKNDGKRMPLAVSLLLFFLSGLCLAQRVSDFDLPLSSKSLEQSLQGGACATSSVSEFCRNFPWTPRAHEGAFGTDSMVTFLVTDDVPSDSEMSRFLFGVLQQRRLEVLALLLLSSQKMSSALDRSSFGSVLVVVRSNDRPPRTIAALFTARSAISNFSSSLAKKWRTELIDAVGWEPPKEFVPFYQFKTF